MTPVSHRPAGWKHEVVSLKDKRVLVTGGTTGIGRTTALLLAHLGAEVMIFARDSQHLQDAIGDIEQAGHHVRGLTADVSEFSEIQRVFREVDDQLGGLDILINNAGLAAGSVTEDDASQQQYVIQTNLLGYMRCAREAVERMKQAGGGHIVNVGSMSAESRSAGNDVYVASKSAIRGFSKSLGKEVSEHQIRVTLVEPGKTGADLFSGKEADPKYQRKQQEKLAMMTSEDIAEAIVYSLEQPLRASVLMLQIQPLNSGS